MQVAIMKIIDMIIVPDRRMPAVATMHVAMVDMMLLGASSHGLFPYFVFSSSGNRRLFGVRLHVL
jgi:hypothetical protein